MTTTNLAKHVEALAEGELIVKVRICNAENCDSASLNAVVGADRNWEEVRPLLDYDYDAGGWDGPEAPDLLAWTESWVIFTHEYDSSTSMTRLPRHPSLAEVMPDTSGAT